MCSPCRRGTLGAVKDALPRTLVCVAALALTPLRPLPILAAGKGTAVWTDPKDPKLPADYQVQGEYVGGVKDGDPLGCQVIALGDGRFQAVFFPGGLPGAGWDTKTKIPIDGKTVEDKTVFEPVKGEKKYLGGSPDSFSAILKNPAEGQRDYRATIIGSTMTGTTDDGKAFTLKRTVRKSPTLGAKPPPGAVVLFDGSNKNEWTGGRLDEKTRLLCTDGRDIRTKKRFSNYRMHVEFMLPFRPHARGQGRGNSGFYQVDHYEVQVLDSFGLEGLHNECGGVYKKAQPSVNMCLPPLQWQTYDIEFRNATTDEAGAKTGNAVITLEHNGIVIHNNVEISGPTGGHRGDPEGTPGPIKLQGHGNPLQYRNIWILEREVEPQAFECSPAVSNMIEVVRNLPTGDARRREIVLEQALENPEGMDTLFELIAMQAAPRMYRVRAMHALHGLALHVTGEPDEVREQFARRLAGELEKKKLSAGTRLALIRELQLVAGPEQAAQLADLTLDPELGSAATQALIAIAGDDARAAVRKALDRAEEAEKVRLILATGMLRDPASIGRLAKSAAGPHRLAAMSALGGMADERAVKPLLKAMAAAKGRYEQIVAAAACFELVAGLARAGETRAATKLCRALGRKESPDYPGYVHMAAMLSLAKLGNRDAIGDFLEALSGEDRQLCAVALDLLRDIPGKDVTRGVIDRMNDAASPVQVQIVGMLGDRGDPLALPLILDCVEHTNMALRLAAIEASGGFGTEASVKTLVKQLQADASCSSAAQLALRKAPGRETDAMIAGTIIEEIERYEDYILEWLVCGPYRKAGLLGDQLLDIAFPPEDPASDTPWRQVRTTDGVVDFLKVAGGENCAGYMKVAVHSPGDQECQLQLGSDDGVKVWLNGNVIHNNNAVRALHLAEDKLSVRLKKGRNTLAMKIVNKHIDWEACARFRKPDGRRLTNLVFKADAEPGEIVMRPSRPQTNVVVTAAPPAPIVRGKGAHDVPWGTGKGDARGMLAEIQRQGLKAVFSVEYEHNWDNSLPEIAACVEFFERTAKELTKGDQNP